MVNKNIILISTLIVFILLTQPSNSVSAAPSPYCEITAKVLNIEKTRTNFQNISGGPSRGDFDYYAVKLDILEITMYKQVEEQYGIIGSCDKSYAETAERAGRMIVLGDYNVSDGQKIRGIIHFGGDEWFGGFFLSDINVLVDERVNDTIKDEIAQGNTTDENITIGKDGKIKDIGSWYYNAPSVIISFIVLYFIMGRKRK
jgi:hypothetical protein